MLAYLMEELREWRERRMRKTVLAGALPLAIVAAAILLKPFYIAIAATVLFVGFGWSEGIRNRSAPSARQLLISFPAPPGSIAAGIALFTLAIWGFTALILSPVLALSAIAWGLPAGASAACLLVWLVAYYAALCVGFFSRLVFASSEGLFGLALVIAWLALPLFLKALAPSNPFVQIWDILKEEGGIAPFVGMAATAAAATALLAAAALIIARIRRGQDMKGAA